jgi:3-oxoacyl-(acyl-carrier-protein) synthase III
MKRPRAEQSPDIMETSSFRLNLYLPAQGSSVIEATILEWRVAEGEQFHKGQALAQVESAKAVFEFEAPCDGKVIRRLRAADEAVPLSEPVLEIETSDPAMRQWIPPVAAVEPLAPAAAAAFAAAAERVKAGTAGLLAVGGYLPQRVVANADLLQHTPHISAEYVEQVTGIRERRWAEDGEKPSDMAYAAAMEAIRRGGIAVKQIDALILATTTPDVAMPATASILQDRLNLTSIPAFDLNAACSGWLYAVAMAQGMIAAGLARTVLTVGVDMQSRLLDKLDESAYYIFGDGAGAAIISADGGHRICHTILGADSRGQHLARRAQPGYLIANGQVEMDPWIRLDGPALFRSAAENFTGLVRRAIAETGWLPEAVRWVVPHQANRRILRAAAKRSGVAFERFYLNVDRVGNTSSASIPLALVEIEETLRPGDKLLLCSVGAGLTTAAVTIEW